MNPPEDDEQAVSSRTGVLLAIVAAVLVLGAVGLVVFGVLGSGGGGDAPNQNAADAAQSSQQAGPLSGTVPLADADTRFEGAGANDTFGAALAHGDVNGDGVEDVVVGAPENDTAGGNKSGAVYVFYGPVNQSDLDAASADVTLTGVEESDRAGYSVAAGDVNGDGTDDVVVGAPLNDRNGSSAGTAYVVHGGDLPESASLADADQTLVGAGAGDRAGWSVATVNRSGGDDVLVGAPRNSSSGLNAGAVYVVSDTDADTVSLADAAATLEGEGVGDLAGWSVAGAGDFDGDGARDFVVGAMNNNSTATEAGAAYVVTANASGTVSLADASLKLAGDAERDHAGWSVAGAGDVNNDSYGDVVVGAPYNDQHGTSAGAAYVVHGGENVTGTANLTDAGTTLLGESEDDQAGYDVSSAGSGDVTCDYYADVLVGAPGNNSTAPSAGAVYVVEGSQDPTAERNLSTATATLVGEGESDRAGHAVSAAGDATDNGSADVLIGASRNDSGEADTGAAYLLAGECPEPEPRDDPEATTTSEERTTEEPTTTAVSAPPATDAPTTEAPTTEAPTTEAPTTEQPTTEAPTPETPTTEAPATTADGAPPATETPTTEAPATEAPTTEELTTEPPTTEAPTTEAPTTEAPTTDAPTTEAPTTETPTTEQRTTEAPTTEQPTTEASTTQAPTTGAPTTEAPTTEPPNTEASTTEQPTTEAASTEAPTTEASNTTADEEQPTTEESTSEEPAPTTEEPPQTTEESVSTTEELAPTTEDSTNEAAAVEQQTTEAPTTEEPTTESPTTEAQTTEQQTTGAQTTEALTTEAATTEAPTTEQQTTEALTTEAVTTEAPATEAATTDAPATEAPTTEQPTTEASSTEAPTTETPTTEAATTEAPTTEAPATEQPTTAPPGQARLAAAASDGPVRFGFGTPNPTSIAGFAGLAAVASLSVVRHD